jgi:sugar-specific transcriptional regulator TrmB
MSKVPTVLERVQKLEKDMLEVTQQVDNIVPLRQTLGEVIEVVQAILNENGEEFEKKIEARIQAKRDEIRRERDARAKQAVDQMVESGILVATDVVTPDTLVVGREFNSSGELTAERVQAVFGMFSQGVQAGISGQGVGYVYETPQGKFEVLEIFKFVEASVPVEGEPAPVAEAEAAPAPVEPAQ